MTNQPHNSDPYPDRSHRHPGARPSTAPATGHARTFTTRPTAPEPVVHLPVVGVARMLTTSTNGRNPVPFDANWTMNARSCVGHTTYVRTPVAPNRHGMTPPANDRASYVTGQQLRDVR